MSTAHVNVQDLKQLQRQLKQTEEEIDRAMKALQRRFDGADWRDSARSKFATNLGQATASVRQANHKLSELGPLLNKTIADAERYLSR